MKYFCSLYTFNLAVSRKMKTPEQEISGGAKRSSSSCHEYGILALTMAINMCVGPLN